MDPKLYEALAKAAPKLSQLPAVPSHGPKAL
jgi:hypothetical protein